MRDDDGFDLFYWFFKPRFNMSIIMIIGVGLVLFCLLFVTVNLSDTVAGLVGFINPLIGEYNALVERCEPDSQSFVMTNQTIMLWRDTIP